MPRHRISQAIGWCAVFSACLGPFLFGSVERSIWLPVSLLWAVLGWVASQVGRRERDGNDPDGVGLLVSRGLLPLHGLFVLQLVPLPGPLLRLLSPSSYAAHFLPYPGDGHFRGISVSPAATVEAWIYLVGLQGLFLGVLGIPPSKRRAASQIVLGAIILLAAEGLWQSRSANPFMLYGMVPIFAGPGMDTTAFGPYFNRNHFATIMAIGTGLAAGFATTVAMERRGLQGVLRDPGAASAVVLFTGVSLFLALASAASGSRSGMIAAVVAACSIGLRVMRKRAVLLLAAAALLGLALAGTSGFERLLSVDVFSSRLRPWSEMSILLSLFPIFGCGLGTFVKAYWPYQFSPTDEYWSQAHNEYLQFAIEGGIVGLLVVIWVGRQMHRGVAARISIAEPGLGVAIAFAVQALFDYPARVPANAALLACALALSIVHRPR